MLLQLLPLMLKKGILYGLLVTLAATIPFWFGYKLASASYEKELREYETRIADISTAISEAKNEAVKRHNIELEAEKRRTTKVQRDAKIISEKAQRIIDETIAENSSSCNNWSATQRLRLEELYNTYNHAP